MAKTYAQLAKEIEKLSREAEKIKAAEVAGVIARIKEAIASYSLTAADLGLNAKGAGGTRRRTKSAAPATAGTTYRNADGQVWGGRGPRPRWLRDAIASGKQLSDFAA